MSFDIKAAIKKPWVKYGLIAIGFVGVLYIVYTRSSFASSGSTDDGTNSADAAAQAAVAQTQIQAQAQAASQESGQQFQLAQQVEADKTSLAGQSASIAGQLQLTGLQNDNSQALANVQLQGLQAQLKQATDALQIQANTQMHISDNQTSVSLGQSANQLSAVKNTNKTSTIGAVVGVAAMALASFF